MKTKKKIPHCILYTLRAWHYNLLVSTPYSNGLNKKWREKK